MFTDRGTGQAYMDLSLSYNLWCQFQWNVIYVCLFFCKYFYTVAYLCVWLWNRNNYEYFLSLAIFFHKIRNQQKMNLTSQLLKIFSTFGQFESSQTNVVLFFHSNSTQIPSLEAFIIIYVCYFLTTFSLGNLFIGKENATLKFCNKGTNLIHLCILYSEVEPHSKPWVAGVRSYKQIILIFCYVVHSTKVTWMQQ